MDVTCDQCNLFFRTEDKLKNHKQGLMGWKCEVEKDKTVLDMNAEIGLQKEKISHFIGFVDETKDTLEESQEKESFEKHEDSDGPDRSIKYGVDYDSLLSLQVQNNEITSTKETQANKFDKSVVNDSIMIIDAESSEDEAEKEAFLEDYDDSEEIESERKVKKSDVDYTLVCVHIETFKVSNDPSISLTQIGCTTALNRGDKEIFFNPVKPARLEHFIENFKMEGDLLKALHMTNENGRFEFRAQFEIKRKEKNKVYAKTEEEALDNLTKYLEKFKNVILFAVDEETLEVILGKLAQLRPDKDLPVAGFTTWPKVLGQCLKYVGKSYDQDSDLEDFYSRHCDDVSGYITALDVANFLRKSVKKLGADYARKFAMTNPGKKFSKNNFIDEIVEDIKNIETTTAGKVEPNKPLTVEVFSSFRPAVSTTIGIEQMDTIELSSGDESEDSDIDIVAENLKPKRYTKRKSTEDSELVSAKRKHPYDFPEYPVSKRPSFNGDTIVISSDEEDDEITLDEEVAPVLVSKEKDFSIPKSLNEMEDMLHKNYTSIRLTKVNEGSWLGKSNPASNPKCCICQIEFEDSKDLEVHTEKEHMFCKVCNLNFDVLSEAILHRRVHEVPKSIDVKSTDDGLSDDEFSDEEKLDTDLDEICKTYDFDATKSWMADSNLANLPTTPLHT